MVLRHLSDLPKKIIPYICRLVSESSYSLKLDVTYEHPQIRFHKFKYRKTSWLINIF